MDHNVARLKGNVAHMTLNVASKGCNVTHFLLDYLLQINKADTFAVARRAA